MRRAARSDRAVLLLGEPGTPKASLAHAVHARSARAQELLVGVDCRSIEPDALEQELFGAAHAVGRVPVTGALATVERGTLVLSGVEALSPWLQGLLLHVLRRGEYARPGSARIRAADVRVLATSDADLDALVRSGQFRADLQSALRGFEISIPPLRQRRRDLRELVDAMCERDESSRLRLDRSAYEALSRCAFPRNDEELREVLADLAAFQQPGSTLSSREIAGLLASRESQWPDAYADALRAFRIQHLRQALERAGGNQAEAGRILGLHPSNLHRMLRVLGLGRERD